jgi:hypothetical protein
VYILLGGWCSIDAAPTLVYVLLVDGTYQINIRNHALGGGSTSTSWAHDHVISLSTLRLFTTLHDCRLMATSRTWSGASLSEIFVAPLPPREKLRRYAGYLSSLPASQNEANRDATNVFYLCLLVHLDIAGFLTFSGLGDQSLLAFSGQFSLAHCSPRRWLSPTLYTSKTYASRTKSFLYCQLSSASFSCFGK